MIKTISIFEQNIGDNGRNYGETHRIMLLDKDYFTIETPKFLHSVPLYEFDKDRIKSMEVFRSSDIKINNTGAGVVGGALLFGLTGAVIGGLAASGDKDAWLLEIIDNQDNVYLYRLSYESDAKIIKIWMSNNL